MVSGQPPRPRRSSRNSEPPSSPTVEDNPASESPTEASVNPHALGEIASRRLAKAAAAAGAAAAASIPASRADITATAGIESAATVGLENAAPIDAAPAAVESAVPTESAVPMESAAPIDAALAVLASAAPKPRKTTRKALGPAGRSGKEPVVLLSDTSPLSAAAIADANPAAATPFVAASAGTDPVSGTRIEEVPGFDSADAPPVVRVSDRIGDSRFVAGLGMLALGVRVAFGKMGSAAGGAGRALTSPFRRSASWWQHRGAPSVDEGYTQTRSRRRPALA